MNRALILRKRNTATFGLSVRSTMALNWAMLEAGNPVPLPGERFLSKFENADVSVLASPNGELPALKRTGVIHVSDQRVRVCRIHL